MNHIKLLRIYSELNLYRACKIFHSVFPFRNPFFQIVLRDFFTMRGLGKRPQQAKVFRRDRYRKLPKMVIWVPKSYACYSCIRSFFQNPLFRFFINLFIRKVRYFQKISELKIGVLAVPNVLCSLGYTGLLDINEVYRRCTFAVPRCTGDVPLPYRTIR